MQDRVPLFRLGFRPFFLLAALAAPVLLVEWLAVFLFGQPLQTGFGPLGWHRHEMLFGFATAIIAGFLLTATSNWTGRPTLTGWALAGLAGLWLAGRLVPLVPGLPSLLGVTLDLAFLPALALSLAPPLWHKGQLQTLIFLPILGGLAVADFLIHFPPAGTDPQAGVRAGLYGVLLLIVIIGGRVIPYFTRKALPGVTPRGWAWLEWQAPVTLLALAVAGIAGAPPVLLTGIAIWGTVVHGLRWIGWNCPPVWSVPLLWVLFLGYGWLVVGFALAAIGASPSSALHAFTAGCIGVMGLGMMSRVALGHTGRPLRAAPLTVAAYGAINLSAAVRVFVPLASPAWTRFALLLSGGLWVTAFLLFLVVYVPILLSPRPDGKPG